MSLTPEGAALPLGFTATASVEEAFFVSPLDSGCIAKKVVVAAKKKLNGKRRILRAGIYHSVSVATERSVKLLLPSIARLQEKLKWARTMPRAGAQVYTALSH